MFQELVKLKEKPSDLEQTLLDHDFSLEKATRWENNGIRLCEHHIAKEGQKYYMIRIDVNDTTQPENIEPARELAAYLRTKYKDLLY